MPGGDFNAEEYIKLKELYNPKWIEKNKNNKNYNKKI